MNRLKIYQSFPLLAILLLMVGCEGVEPEAIYEVVYKEVIDVVEVYITATPRPTRAPTATYTPSPTPTPTAVPVVVAGDPREVVLSDPVPHAGAPCGVVDTLDFPLNPPDAVGAFGGQDFGRFRNRFDGYHTGEDWGFGAGNFGVPVYSIGHGQVTYAQPLGWGEDQGVIIIQHIFQDGSRLLSFYGHLDPPSITLRAGECVMRGDQVGEIGRPRTPPHLHFEIRSHLPDTPGPGYWSVDPSLSGWKSPSETIWKYRMATSPGVKWMLGNPSWLSRYLGETGDGTVIVFENQQVVGIDIEIGELRWEHPLADNMKNAMLDTNRSLVYATTSFGILEVYRVDDLSSGTSETPTEPLWTVRLNISGNINLMPLPGGGVILSTRNRMMAVSEVGDLIWEIEINAPVIGWTLAGDRIIFTTDADSDSLWSADISGATVWESAVTGKLVSYGDRVNIYAQDGIYRLNFSSYTADLLFSMPKGSLRKGDISILPDGGLLVAHIDLYDQRLIALESNGDLRWERSLASIPLDQLQLITLNDQVYLMSKYETSASNEVTIFLVDIDSGELSRIFLGGTRNPIQFTEDTWATVIGGDNILINIGGGGLVALDPQIILAAIFGDISSP
jgi:murein DD-endopeptidase MepM/ murein hydrolase activator NlpD